MKDEKLILFDVDGVIVDSFKGNYLAARDFIKTHSGHEIDEAEYRKLMEGNAWENVYKKAEKMISEQISEEEVNSFFVHYPEYPVFEGIKDVIEKLSENNILVINTSTFITYASQVLDREGISPFFSAFLGPKTSIRKDDKIRIAMKEFEKPAKDTIFVTDTAGDVLEGKKVGITTIGVTYGYHDRKTMEEVSPDHIIDNPEQLLTILN